MSHEALSEFGTEKMAEGSDKPGAEEGLASAAFADRVEKLSEEYRMKLQRKAATMREAVLNGETRDGRVLAVAEALERLAGDKTSEDKS